ncbi:MAG: DnaJ domain-containing protein [Deltaproteobacteria bacterium]|nr:DnaJ domain-containing protein [Deltaproteobacteria bacterium]
MAKSYYAILGVAASASSDEIRSAYRRLVKEFHPDHFRGGSGAFLQIQEAYSVLGDAYKRREYESSLLKSSMKRSGASSPYPQQPEPLIPEQQPVDMGDISPLRSFQTFSPSMDEIFDWLWNNFAGLDRLKSGRIQNLTLEVTLTREQAMRGGNARIMVPARSVCPVCRGYGGVGFCECYRCAGEGAISGEVPISISFPAGLGRDHAVLIPLDRFGIRNLQLTVLFRITDDR